MLRTLPLLIAVFLAVPRPAAGLDHQKLARSLADTEREFARITAASNVRDGFLKYFAEDCISFAPEPGLAVPRLTADQPDDSIILDWKPVVTGLSRAGDLGYNTGPVTITERKSGKLIGRSYFMSIWRHQPDGQWRVILDIGGRIPEGHVAPDWAMMPLSPYVKKDSGVPSPDSILAIEERFRSAVAEKGAMAAYPAFLDRKEIRLHRRLHQPMTTWAAAEEYLRAQQQRGTLAWKLVAAKIAASGDLGYSYGTYSITPAGAPAVEEGSYTHLWKRDAAGDWKLVLDVAVPFPPKQPAQ